MEMTFSSGWTDFTRRIFINADISTVYNAWAKSSELEKWFFEKAEYVDGDTNIDKSALVQSGNTAYWQWFGWPHAHTGNILLAKQDERLEFDFNPGGRVALEFNKVQENRTELILHQSEIPSASENDIKMYYYGCSLGWSFWMLNLKAWLEHGIVLNEKSNPYKDDPRKLELVNH